jgi:hypothetical protein
VEIRVSHPATHLYFAPMARFLPLLLVLPLAGAFADTIKLKSGETVQGKVVKSDASSVTVEVQFSPTITDQRQIARADIAAIAFEAPDVVAFAKICDLQPPATALDSKPYQAMVDAQLKPFLKKFGYSAHAADVKAKIAEFQTDITRLDNGEVKVSGNWYDKAAATAEKYQIAAAALLAEMQAQIAAANFPGAMNAFDKLQRYQNSTAYAEAIVPARKALARLQQQLDFAIANIATIQAQRQAAIARTPEEQRADIQRAFDAEQARATALAAAAQKNGERFFTIFPFDEQGLKSMQQAAQQAATQLAAVNTGKLSAGAKLVQTASSELASNEVDAAESTLAELRTTWPEYEGLNRLQQWLRAEQAARKSAPDAAASATRAPAPGMAASQ